MRVHSRKRSGRLSLFACAIVAACAPGCGGRRGVGGLPGGVPMAGYDHYFFVGLSDAEEMTELERQQRIDREIERLATPAWKTARENLFKLGKPAIDRLIENLDRTEASSASVQPVPGPTVPEKEQAWPVGYVVYIVLLDFVGGYTNYAGTYLPGFDKRDWSGWWSANRKGLLVYDARTTAPAYVQEQLARAEVALSSRYKTIAETVKRQRASEAKMRGEWEEKGGAAAEKEAAEREARQEREREEPAAKRRRRREEPVEEEVRERRRRKAEKAPEPEPREEAKEEPKEEAKEEPKESKEEVKEEPPQEERRPRRRGRRRR